MDRLCGAIVTTSAQAATLAMHRPRRRMSRLMGLPKVDDCQQHHHDKSHSRGDPKSERIGATIPGRHPNRSQRQSRTAVGTAVHSATPAATRVPKAHPMAPKCKARKPLMAQTLTQFPSLVPSKVRSAGDGGVLSFDPIHWIANDAASDPAMTHANATDMPKALAIEMAHLVLTPGP